MKPQEFFEGDVFQHGQKIRRIVGVAKDSKGRQVICYSSGGNKNRYCKTRAFKKFSAGGRLIHGGIGRAAAIP